MLFGIVFAVVADRPELALAQNPVFTLPSAQTAGESGHLASSSRNGNVFVGAGGILYRLSSELQQLQNVSISAFTVGLTTTADGDWLVACFNTSSCSVYNTSDLNIINTTVNDIYSPGSSANIALFTAPISGMQTFYVGSIDRRRAYNLVQRGFAGSTVSRGFVSNPAHIGINREIYGGFHYNNNSYFMALDSPIVMTIIRVCNDGGDKFNAVYEAGYVFPHAGVAITGVSEVDGMVLVSVNGQVFSIDLTFTDTLLDNFFIECLGTPNSSALNFGFFATNVHICRNIVSTTK